MKKRQGGVGERENKWRWKEETTMREKLKRFFEHDVRTEHELAERIFFGCYLIFISPRRYFCVFLSCGDSPHNIFNGRLLPLHFLPFYRSFFVFSQQEVLRDALSSMTGEVKIRRSSFGESRV